MAELYWVRSLTKPFALNCVPGLNEKRYRTAQRGFAKFHDADAMALFHHLSRTNRDVLLDFVNDAERPER